jgi:glucosylceramidase
MRRPLRSARLLLAGLLTTAGLATLGVPSAHAAGEQVTAWLTTTDDSGGRHVVRGLEPQTPFSFQSGTGGGGENITVD